jgi:hypothetical protein
VAADVLLRKPTTGIAGCCARAASGHVAATPLTSVMNSRRLASPHLTSPGWTTLLRHEDA